MGRLIDEDVLLKNLEWLDDYDHYILYDIEISLDETPTVKAIPIDKPFLKMRYGDYVVYNKKWLVDHLQTEWNILQGKEYQPSIPIEWLKKWEGYEQGMAIVNLKDIVKYWEKENENL